MQDCLEYLSAGQRIFVAGSSNEPTALLDYLRTCELPSDLHFVQFPIGGYNSVDFTSMGPQSQLTTFFMTSALRHADPSRLHFLPMQMRAVYDYLKTNIDVCLLQVAYDRNGELRVGPNVDFVDAVIGSGAIVIAELNRAITAPAGSMRISESRIACLFESERSLAELPSAKIDDTAMQIGRYVSELVNDGDCLQTGIGAIPAAILAQLNDKNDLGMHGGLIDDGGMALIQAGNLNGRCKPIDQGQHVTGMALGSQALLNWLSGTPEVVFRGANHTHEVSVISQLPNFVSINSAVEVDLFGQVNAEFASGRQISGTGGSVDFMRAAKSSKGGRSIVAMTATAKGGTVSRIVPKVELVTALRTDIDILVTEYGVAHLQGLSAQARLGALIELAAPQFRSELAQV